MKISIITVCKNSASTIEQTINSIISQKDTFIEYIIVDGKSQDDTIKIINKYLNYIDVLISEQDRGISDAFNKGIKKASGDVIGLINADDILLKGALKIVQKEMHPDTDIFFGNIQLFENIIEIPYIFKPERASKVKIKELEREMVIPHPATFVKRSAYEKFGIFDERYKNAMDRELLLRMYKGGAVFQQTDYVLTLFRRGGTTESAFQNSIDESYEISIKYGTSPIIATATKLKKQLYRKLYGNSNR